MTRARQWSVLTAVACLAVVAAGWFVLVKPQRTHAASLRTQASQVDQSNQALQNQIAHLQAEAKDLPEQQRTLAKIATLVPDSPALPTLIRQLSAAADASVVNLVSLSPGQPTLVASPLKPAGTTTPATGSAPVATTATTPAAGAAGAPGAVLAAIPLQIQVQGNYAEIEAFFRAIENLPRAMMVTQFSAAPLDSGANVGATPALPGTLNVTLTASVYESPDFAAPATPTTGK